MCVITDGSEKPIPDDAVLISDNHIAQVWRSKDGYIFKRSMPFLIENELYCLQTMWPTGFVPYAWRYDKYTIAMQDMGDSEPVTDKNLFVTQMYQMIAALRQKGIRHGDITKYAIVVKDNNPYLIDFAESRLWDDPRPDKRKEGDGYWLRKAIDEITKES